MLLFPLSFLFAKAEDWAPRAEALLQALTHQTEAVAKENADTSDKFHLWCHQATPWTQSLLSLLEQQRLETKNMQHQVQSNIARMQASSVLDKVAVGARDRLTLLANTTMNVVTMDGNQTKSLEERARVSLSNGSGDEDLTTKFAALAKDLGTLEEEEDDAKKDRTIAHQRFLLHAQLMEKAQEVENQNLQVQLAERERTRARYHSEVNDMQVIEQVARNSSQVLESICLRQTENAGELQKSLEEQIEKSRAVEGSANPMSTLFVTSSTSFLQVAASVPIHTQPIPAVALPEIQNAPTKKMAQDLLHDIDALSDEEKEETSLVDPKEKMEKMKKTENTLNEGKTEMTEWCSMMHVTSQRALLTQGADLRHTKARMELANTNAVLLKEQLAYFHARRQEIDALLKNLDHITHPKDFQDDLDTYTRRIPSLTTSGAPQVVRKQLHELVEILEHNKHLLRMRGQLWLQWRQELHVAMTEIDHRLGETFVHYQSRQQEAVSTAAFLASMQSFAVADYKLQESYVQMLEKACSSNDHVA